MCVFWVVGLPAGPSLPFPCSPLWQSYLTSSPGFSIAFSRLRTDGWWPLPPLSLWIAKRDISRTRDRMIPCKNRIYRLILLSSCLKVSHQRLSLSPGRLKVGELGAQVRCPQGAGVRRLGGASPPGGRGEPNETTCLTLITCLTQVFFKSG